MTSKSLRLPARLALVVVGASVLAVVLLRPQPAERSSFAAVLVTPALVAAVAVTALARWVANRRSVRALAIAVGLCSLSIGAVASAAAARAMFISAHDYRMFVVLLALSTGVAFVVGTHLGAPVGTDIRRLGVVASAVADGDLTQRTQVARRDEVGQVAAAVDRMVGRLTDAESERRAVTLARQHLLSSVSHDLRTPLSAMRAAVESIRDGVAPDPDRYLEIVEWHLSATEQLLDQLHEFTRIEAGSAGANRQTVSLAELADDAVESLAPLADRRGVGLLARTTGTADVDVNPGEVSRVIRNLLDNAIRHSPTGGTVLVQVTESDVVRLDVIDEGEGFEEAFRSVAFEPLTCGDPARGSTGSSGLGLAIAKALVDTHGGSIALGSGVGGCVTVEFPRAQKPTS